MPRACPVLLPSEPSPNGAKSKNHDRGLTNEECRLIEERRRTGPVAMAEPALPAQEFYRIMLLAREGDRREGILFRQGKGWFHVGGAGHESVGALAYWLEPEDCLFPCYRDRALTLARGVTNYDLALAFFAKAASSSGGRMMPGHFNSKPHNIFSVATPVGSQCLPAVGYAWTLKLAGTHNIALCMIGDAATRQGEFYEAVAFALQEQLPVVFVVEDNAYGISTPTADLTPNHLGLLPEEAVVRVDGRDVNALYMHGGDTIQRARDGAGPSILWCALDRLGSHTSSDDHRVYRTPEDLAVMRERDPITLFGSLLVQEGALGAEDLRAIKAEVAAQVDADYRRAAAAPDPDPAQVLDHLYGQSRDAGPVRLDGGETTMVAAINQVLHRALEEDPKVLMLGEDIADPKGGVFGLTKGLSAKFPDRVRNAPLAEATIVGTAVGVAAAGWRPVFELQFIDFIGPAMNQLMTHMGTLRWRSNGTWKCPLVILAPYGAYLPAGGIWHSESMEGLLACHPGIHIVVPSRPDDAAALLWSAIHGDDPVMFLVPKHIFRKKEPVDATLEALPLGKAAVVQPGRDVTLVTWGNCVDLAIEAAAQLEEDDVSIEILDLRTIVPCDWHALLESLEKTGRLVVLHEDRRTGGFGQAIITQLLSAPESWDLFQAPPQLVAREDAYIPYNPILEAAVLPDLARIVEAVRITIEH
jgi:2-oxoisovalerate dehydrogenase E1 component